MARHINAGGGTAAGFGRLRARRRGRALIGVALVAVLIGGVLVYRHLADGCGGERTQISVMTDAAVAEPLGPIAAAASKNSCFDYRIAAVANVDVPGRLSARDTSVDLWLADSQTRARRVTEQVRIKTDLVAPSVASSPVVVVGSMLGSPKSWVEVMSMPKLQVGNPIDTSTGEAPIIGGVASLAAGKISQSTFVQAMTMMATQRHSVAVGKDSDDARFALANTSDVPTVASEQQYLSFLRGNPGSRLMAKVPAEGTVMLTYPLVNTAQQARRDLAARAGRRLVESAESISGRKILNEKGFRSADGTGIGSAVTVLTFDDTAVINKALQNWQIFAIPTRMLEVLDTSGSMRTRTGGASRAELVAEATVGGLELLGNSAKVGLWIFGINKGGKGKDWKEVAPIRRLDDRSAGSRHRARLAALIRKAMSDKLGGGTGLYDTTLAAYKRMVDTYDPTTTNTVAIVTDGKNEDADSITLDELLSQLASLQDPGRPVRIVAIGVSDEADESALRKIGEVTGGTSYIAREPKDIKGIFTTEVSKLVQD